MCLECSSPWNIKSFGSLSETEIRGKRQIVPRTILTLRNNAQEGNDNYSWDHLTVGLLTCRSQ